MSFYIDMTQYAGTIETYESYPVETGKILLYGSSFFRNWGYDRAKEQWKRYAGLDVVNHGFGGATVDELLYYYDRMVRPYKPSAAVLRPGHNDLTRGLSPEEAWFLTERLIAWLRTDCPDLPVVLLEVFDTKKYHNPERCALNDAYNHLMRKFAAEQEGVFTVDLDPFFHDEQGELRDIFIEDGLHLTDSGYEEMASWLTPQIKDLLAR